MGLDILAFRKLHEVPRDTIEFDEYGDFVDEERYLCFDHYIDFCEKNWPGRVAPYEKNPDACYEFEEETYMRAGSYMGYNQWRGILSDFAVYLHGGIFPRMKQDLDENGCLACCTGEIPEANEDGDLVCPECGITYLGDEGVADSNVFSELIEFSDCEGVIGPVVSEKLYRDFLDNRHLADGFAALELSDHDQMQWFLDKYDQWMEMFSYGADDGAVMFA